jgi:hypothetical protein
MLAWPSASFPRWRLSCSADAAFLTSTVRAVASIFKMKEVSQHKSLDFPVDYVRDAKTFTYYAGEGLA